MVLQQSEIEDAAMFLLHLRTQRTQVSTMPSELAPKSLDEAYAIQAALHQFSGSRLGAYKVGCTSAIAQEVLGVPHPIGGQISVEGVFGSGTTAPRDFFAGAPALECEIALRLTNGIVDAAAPALELVNGRFSDMSRVNGFAIIADNSAGAAMVLGTPVPIAEIDDLNAIDVVLTSNGRELATGSSASILGGPQSSVDWTVAQAAERGHAIGDSVWVITGTCTGLTPSEFGNSYRADFGQLGSVSVTLGD